MPEDGEFSEEDIDKYVFGVRVYEDRFEWLLNLSPEARGELDDKPGSIAQCAMRVLLADVAVNQQPDFF